MKITIQCSICEPQVEQSYTDFWESLASRLRQFSNYLARRRQLRQDRDAFNAMLSLDDVLLKDSGVNRDNVHWASKLPLEVNAADELRRLSQKDGILFH